MINSYRSVVATFCGLCFLASLNGLPVGAEGLPTRQPNFLILVADDMGWSDLSLYGSEIETPNIDNLAKQGFALTNFHVAPTCAPTRAMLLTGVNNHAAGLATQLGQAVANQESAEHYQGELLNRVVTMAEVMKEHGYATMMAGKWHIGYSEQQRPHNRGFDRSFVLLEGGGSHFSDALPLNPVEPMTYLEDGELAALPDDFYSSRFYTDKILQYLDARPADKPFLAYVGFTAPHDPLQVPKSWMGRKAGAYDEGPEQVAQERMVRQKALGLLDEGAIAARPFETPRILPSYRKPWSERPLEERQLDVKPMEIYASMIEYMDDQIGRLVEELRQRGDLENTYIIFFSDNRASAVTPLAYPGATRQWLHNNRNMDPVNAGLIGTHTHLSTEWTSVANAPFKLFKATTAEGGTRTPLVMSGPGIPYAGFLPRLSHVTDIVPTIYELAGIDTATDSAYTSALRPEGESLLEALRASDSNRAPIVTELFGNWSVVEGTWKLSQVEFPFGTGKPQLFDLVLDPGESSDVSDSHQDIVDHLSQVFEDYVRENEVIAPKPKIRRNPGVFFTDPCDFICSARIGLARTLMNKTHAMILLASILLLSLFGFGLLVRTLIQRNHPTGGTPNE